jgi:hypothetical protein
VVFPECQPSPEEADLVIADVKTMTTVKETRFLGSPDWGRGTVGLVPCRRRRVKEMGI